MPRATCPLMVMIPGEDVYCFLAGDPRVNEQTVLAVVHLLMVREHNRSNITRVTCPAVICPAATCTAVTCHTCCHVSCCHVSCCHVSCCHVSHLL